MARSKLLGNKLNTKNDKNKNVPASGKKHRFRPGTVALRKIKKYQRSTLPVIARALFTRIARKTADTHKNDLRFTQKALLNLQDGTESYFGDLMGDSLLCALHANRKRIFKRDLFLPILLREKPSFPSIKKLNFGDWEKEKKKNKTKN